MKKFRKFILLALLTSVFATGCNGGGGNTTTSYTKEEDPDIYEINYTDISLALESSFQLNVYLKGTIVTATWSTDNDNVTVNNGLVKGMKIGESNVYATIKNQTLKCKVDVTISQNVPELILNASSTLNLEVGDTYTLVPSLRYQGEVTKAENVSCEIVSGSIMVIKELDNTFTLDALFAETSELIIKAIWHELSLYAFLTVVVK